MSDWCTQLQLGPVDVDHSILREENRTNRTRTHGSHGGGGHLLHPSGGEGAGREGIGGVRDGERDEGGCKARDKELGRVRDASEERMVR